MHATKTHSIIYKIDINTSKQTPHYWHSAKPFVPRRQDGTSLPPGIFKSSIIRGRWAEDEVGSAARERPQMKSVNGMYIITASTNHNGHQLPIDVSIIANHLHSYM